MSAKAQRINISLRDQIEPEPCLLAPRRGPLEEQVERLKDRLLDPIIRSIENAALAHYLRSVANEAAAMAWSTACPVLVLPTLLEEKLCAALRRWERQQIILQR